MGVSHEPLAVATGAQRPGHEGRRDDILTARDRFEQFRVGLKRHACDLSGTLVRVLFDNPDTMWAVTRVKPDDGLSELQSCRNHH